MKYALITGGSRGIGKAVCLKLAADLNYNILLNYHSNTEAAELTKQEIEKYGVQCDLLKFNVSDDAAVQSAIATWKASHPEDKIEILVNNAGITKDGLFIWTNTEAWDTVMDTSVRGFYNVTQAVLKDMLRSRYGRIINMVSLSGLKGNPGQVNYSAAKGAMISATKALAQEIGKRKVTVNAVAPGFIKSDMTIDFDEDGLKKHIPVNRFGDVDEVADLVSFLASDKSSYITGEVININGGLYS
ncbi:3-oxoacyl-ACP reductase FabG [Christiangramia sabulilitoris]|uniref:3-oxoacyl-ACP reductase FabG n=1 Tax=Christiangramia sabulilitoris TaxID=2583991 RepID=A0A550I611_9FLAO|nr:3-oxoacyl-ACP reductase FabG [Christiangramia sabulilitoris]TRO66412.1 3-oxoacyl-ACP reductase FabG [Christiangramia sabulilitoris]